MESRHDAEFPHQHYGQFCKFRRGSVRHSGIRGYPPPPVPAPFSSSVHVIDLTYFNCLQSFKNPTDSLKRLRPENLPKKFSTPANQSHKNIFDVLYSVEKNTQIITHENNRIHSVGPAGSLIDTISLSIEWTLS